MRPDSPETAETLENAYDAELKVPALTIADREAIVRALDAAPYTGWPNSAACFCASTSGALERLV